MPCPCPNCFAILDVVMYEGEAHVAPKPGSLSLCIHCGLPSRYDANMTLEALTQQEWLQIISNPQAMFHMVLFKAFVAARGPIKPALTSYAA